MPKIVRYTKETVFKKFDELTKKGIKLTKKNLDNFDAKLYSAAEDMFGGWMECKRAYYNYLSEIKNPEKNLERIVIKKTEELEEKFNLKVSVDSKLNEKFVKYAEDKEPFFVEIILNTFVTWENFYNKYIQLATPIASTFSEIDMIKEISSAILEDNLIRENVFSKKHPEIYYAIVHEYGSLAEGLVYLLNNNIDTSKDNMSEKPLVRRRDINNLPDRISEEEIMNTLATYNNIPDNTVSDNNSEERLVKSLETYNNSEYK